MPDDHSSPIEGKILLSLSCLSTVFNNLALGLDMMLDTTGDFEDLNCRF